MLKSRNVLNFNTSGESGMKIYSYKGKHNISGEKIRQARVLQRISQSDLAARLQVEGVSLERDSISRIENGSRFVTDYELLVFSRILGVSIDFLLQEESPGKGASF